MSRLAIRIPDALRARMREVPVNWSRVVRDAIEARLSQFERERLLVGWAERPRPGSTAEAGEAVRLIREDRDS